MHRDVECTADLAYHKHSHKEVDLGGISWRVLEVAGKVGRDLEGEVVQTERAARKSKAIKANAIK